MDAPLLLLFGRLANSVHSDLCLPKTEYDVYKTSVITGLPQLEGPQFTSEAKERFMPPELSSVFFCVQTCEGIKVKTTGTSTRKNTVGISRSIILY